MRIENRRIITRKNVNKTVVEDFDLGIFLSNNNFDTIQDLKLKEYGLLDFSIDGNILLLNSREWLIRRNANKTWVTAIDLNSNENLFKTDKFLAYRSIIDSTSTKCLLEFYNGLCTLDLKNGETIFRKDKIDKSLYNSDIHYSSNKVFIPTERKSLLSFDFNTNKLEEIKLDKTSGTSWLKFNNEQTDLYISDKKNSLYCFEIDSLQNPVWTIDFSKFKTDTRIWPSPILTTDSNIGCIHATRPCPDQVGYCSGSLYILDMKHGKVLDNLEYAGINLKQICDTNSDEILLDDFTKLSLTTKEITNTLLTSLLSK